MKLTFLGHAAFALEAGGTRICLDPHAPGVLGGRFQLPAIVGPFDAIVATHRHEDHLAWRPQLGTDRVVDTDSQVGDVAVRFRAVPHDAVHGAAMGWVRMASLTAEGLRVVHAGDVGSWTEADVAWLRGTDVLLLPVGGTYTLDGPGAAALCARVRPRCVVPMHAQDPRVDLPLHPVAPFLDALAWPVAEASELRLPSDLPTAPTALVLSAP